MNQCQHSTGLMGEQVEFSEQSRRGRADTRAAGRNISRRHRHDRSSGTAPSTANTTATLQHDPT